MLQRRPAKQRRVVEAKIDLTEPSPPPAPSPEKPKPHSPRADDAEITDRLTRMCTAALQPSSKFVEHVRNPKVRVLICNTPDTYGTIETLCAWVRLSSRNTKRGIRVDCSNLATPLVEALNSIWVDPTAIPVLDGLTVPLMGTLERFMRKIPAHRRLVVHTDDPYQADPAMRALRRVPGAEVTKCTTVNRELALKCCNYLNNTYRLGWPQAAIQQVVAMSNLDVRWIHNAIRFRAIKDGPTLLHSKDSDRAGETDRWARLITDHHKTFKVTVDLDKWEGLRNALAKFAQMGPATKGFRLKEAERVSCETVSTRVHPPEKIGPFSMRRVDKVEIPPVTSREKVEVMIATFRVDAPYVDRLIEAVEHFGGRCTDEQHLGGLPDRGRNLVAATYLSMMPAHNQRRTMAAIADDLSQADTFEGDYRHIGPLGPCADAVWRMTPGVNYRRYGLARTPRDLAASTRSTVDTFIKSQMQFRGRMQTNREMAELQREKRVDYADAALVQRLVWSIYIPLGGAHHPMCARDAALYAAVALKMDPPKPGEFARKPGWELRPVESREGRELAAWFGERCTYPHFGSTAWVLAWAALAASHEMSTAPNSHQILGLISAMIQAGARQAHRVGEVVPQRPPGGWLSDLPRLAMTVVAGKVSHRPPIELAIKTYAVWLAAKKLL